MFFALHSFYIFRHTDFKILEIKFVFGVLVRLVYSYIIKTEYSIEIIPQLILCLNVLKTGYQIEINYNFTP